MKYILASFFLLTLTSCSWSNPSGEKIPEDEIPEVRVGWVQISDSGVSVSDESGNFSIGASGDILINNGSENISARGDGVGTSSGEKNTGTTSSGAEKDPEFQKIQQDIDAIFSDILGSEGK